ncbi:hypothetical protein [Flavobacterium microcysteis]|uniref:Uncharacterized protein n=1 Tax=Flavobacterium microcysteis TaxID=2596891 RepID=A0A501QN45_9FLAO|nr:hypothetical protein [Flavobacterium microcysteis]TPD73587.1 hypothetical protein FJA49_00725 [Flavobacterium microcysteis]
MRNKNLILNYIFIIGILILFINDQFLKFAYPGLITGKLSDVCGIIIFPLLLTYIFPKLRENSVWIAMLIFAYWKSPYSQNLIDFYNQFSPIETSRIIDYSDLLVFVLLPIPYFILKKNWLIEPISIKKANPLLILIPSILILIAEAPPKRYYYTKTNGNLKCFKCDININQSQNDIIVKLGQNGIIFDSIKPIYFRGVIDSVDGAKRLFKREMIIDKDTLRNIDITLVPLKKNKTKLYFNGMDVPKNLSDENLVKDIRKYYRKIIFEEIKRKL